MEFYHDIHERVERTSVIVQVVGREGDLEPELTVSDMLVFLHETSYVNNRRSVVCGDNNNKVVRNLLRDY